MPTQIIYATILFTVALVLYSVAIWSDRHSPQLKRWQILVFFVGVVADIWGVWLSYLFVGQWVFTPHAILGFTALGLMLLHFIWLLLAFKSQDQQKMASFRRFGVAVWSVWLVSYLSGFVSGIQKLM